MVGNRDPRVFSDRNHHGADSAYIVPCTQISAVGDRQNTGQRRSAVRFAACSVPVLFVAVFVSGFAEGGFYTIFPIYGVERQLAPSNLAILISVYGFGGMLLQLPAG